MSAVADWKELEREPILDCGIFSVERSRVLSPPDGSEHDFYRIVSVEWAQLVPVTREGDADAAAGRS